MGCRLTVFGVLITAFLYNVVPSAPGRAWMEPLLGHGLYTYVITNKFVITNLVAVPLTMVFFCLTRLAYRPLADPKYEQNANEFFRRMATPVDFEKEVGGDNTATQARVLGAIACFYGAFITCLLLIPNPWLGRAGILVHPYLLGPNGQSNGCVSVKDYPKFLAAFKRGEVERMVVVARLEKPPAFAAKRSFWPKLF